MGKVSWGLSVAMERDRFPSLRWPVPDHESYIVLGPGFLCVEKPLKCGDCGELIAKGRIARFKPIHVVDKIVCEGCFYE